MLKNKYVLTFKMDNTKLYINENKNEKEDIVKVQGEFFF